VSPAWSLEGGAGGTPPAPPPTGPPTEGLILWLKGDAGLTSVAGAATAWADQSGFGQDVGLFPLGDAGPFTGLESIDGVPAITFPTDGGVGAVPGRALYRVDLRDRFGALFGYNVGERQPRTIIAMIRPRNSTAFFNVTGGMPVAMVSNPGFGAIFDVESTDTPGGFYAWSRGWRSLSAGQTCEAPSVTAGAGGTYDDQPTLAVWASTGFPVISFAVNNVNQALTPSTMPGATGPGAASFWIGRVNQAGPDFFGAMTELLIWDYDLTTDDPAGYAQAVAYMKGRYPSAPIV